MTALTCWNDYIWPLITISSQRRWTITLGLVTFQERYAGMAAWGPLFAGYVVASLPLIALLASGMRHFIAGLTSGAVKG
jgi:ABC-type glycerol-3-phosphate transport system permease component